MRLAELEKRMDMRFNERAADLERRLTMRMGGIMVAGTTVDSVRVQLI